MSATHPRQWFLCTYKIYLYVSISPDSSTFKISIFLESSLLSSGYQFQDTPTHLCLWILKSGDAQVPDIK